jgi:hypothetical protein
MPNIHIHLHRTRDKKRKAKDNRYAGLNARSLKSIRTSLEQRIAAGGSSGEEAKKLLVELAAAEANLTRDKKR